MNMPNIEHFLCDIEQVQNRIELIDPRLYDKTRNYLDGSVTWLSPFITHGVINTRTVADTVLKAHAPKSCYRLLFELAWREFFQQFFPVLQTSKTACGTVGFSIIYEISTSTNQDLPGLRAPLSESQEVGFKRPVAKHNILL